MQCCAVLGLRNSTIALPCPCRCSHHPLTQPITITSITARPINLLTQKVLLLGSSQPPSVQTARQASARGLLLPADSCLYSCLAAAGWTSAVEETTIPKSCCTSCSHSRLAWEALCSAEHTDAAVQRSEADSQLSTAHRAASSRSRRLPLPSCCCWPCCCWACDLCIERAERSGPAKCVMALLNTAQR